MPPLQKITKDDILQTAFNIVRESGPENLNARSIAKALNCSTQPVFSCYANMADLKADVFAMADQYHTDYFNRVEVGEDFFLNIGLAYVDFALEEPNLFRLLFMSNGFSGINLGEFVMNDCSDHLTRNMPNFIDRHSDATNALFTDMWLYMHGVSTMLVMNQLKISKEEIREMLARVIHSLISTLPPKEE
jgi:hypothetical protein